MVALTGVAAAPGDFILLPPTNFYLRAEAAVTEEEAGTGCCGGLLKARRLWAFSFKCWWIAVELLEELPGLSDELTASKLS